MRYLGNCHFVARLHLANLASYYLVVHVECFWGHFASIPKTGWTGLSHVVCPLLIVFCFLQVGTFLGLDLGSMSWTKLTEPIHLMDIDLDKTLVSLLSCLLRVLFFVTLRNAVLTEDIERTTVCSNKIDYMYFK